MGLKETVVLMAKEYGVRWYGHVFRSDDGHVLRKALEFEVRTTKEDVEDASGDREQVSVGLVKEDAMNRTRWRVGVEEIDVRVG